MEIRTLTAISISERSQVSEARRVATGLARSLGFDEAETGKVAIVVTEAATNLVKHAGEGELIFSALRCEDQHGVGLLALDRGPGIARLAESLRDGHSTSGSAGTGLGAIMRLSSEFDIYSLPGAGTALMARFWPGRQARQRPRYPVEIGAVSIPMPGEEVCGDAWSLMRTGAQARLLVSDGLGHGIDAAEASSEAVRIFEANPDLTPGPLLQALDVGLRHTRGAVIAAALVDTRQQVVRYAGVGNISGVIQAPGREYNMVSLNGTMGHQVRKIQEFAYPWPEGALMILHTDGLSRRWDFANYPGLAARSPSLIAGVLFRQCKRERDDVTVVVLRQARVD